MATSEQELLADIQDNLALLESGLFELEKTVSAESVNPSLIHVLFRYAHNMKGGCAVLERAECVALMYAVEGSMDLVRNGQASVSAKAVDLWLTATSPLAHFLDCGFSEVDFGEIAEGLATLSSEASTIQSANADSFIDLDASESEAQERAFKANHNFYILTKLVSGNLAQEQFRSLPIFEDISSVGALIGIRPRFEKLPKDQEAPLQFLFASGKSAEEVANVLFDSFQQGKLFNGSGRLDAGVILPIFEA